MILIKVFGLRKPRSSVYDGTRQNPMLFKLVNRAFLSRINKLIASFGGVQSPNSR